MFAEFSMFVCDIIGIPKCFRIHNCGKNDLNTTIKGLLRIWEIEVL